MTYLHFLFAVLVTVSVNRIPIRAAEPKPNVVYILADDLGYGDVGCYNPASKIPTPNLDRLAKEGVRFTDAHSPSAVCTPTRYALLTGRYAWRTRLQRNVIGPYAPPLIAAKQLTVPAMLRDRGYATACVGKWHLGWGWPKPDAAGERDFTHPIPDGPTARGFDSYFGTDVPNYPPFCFLENDRTVGIPSVAAPVGRDSFNIAGLMVPDWKLVDVLPGLVKRAVSFIETAAKGEKPFFLYLPLTSPHFPVVPSAEFKGKSPAGDYGDFVMQTDHVVGQVLDALRRSGVADKTLVVFTSDNGPEVAGEVNPGAYDRLKRYGHASAGTLRGVKRDAWEGGHRVPFLARWPGKIPAGRTSAETVCHVDLMATLAALLEVKLPPDAGVDSVNILPALLNEKRTAPLREATVHHSAQCKFAIRKGDWVLILAPTGDDNRKQGEPAWFRTDRGYAPHADAGELFDLATDPTQQKNRYATEPAKVKELAAVLERYVAEGRSTPGPKQANDVPVAWDQRGGRPMTHAFLATGQETFLVDAAGKTVWTYPHASRDGWVLANGNVLLALSKSKTYPGGAVAEVTRAGKIVFEFKGSQAEVNTVQPLGDGTVLLTEAGDKPRVLEVDRAGKIVADVPIAAQTKDHHLQTRMTRKLANGNYLVPQLLDRAVREYDAKGKVVWEAKTPNMPFTAIRLPDGNTLIGCTVGNLIIEVDNTGKEAWRVTNDDLPTKPISDACGVQRLDNGNTVFTSYRTSQGQRKLIEITREKKIVWTYTDERKSGIHHFQILDGEGKPTAKPLR